MFSQLQEKPAGLRGCPLQLREPRHDNPRAVSPKSLSPFLKGHFDEVLCSSFSFLISKPDLFNIPPAVASCECQFRANCASDGARPEPSFKGD